MLHVASGLQIPTAGNVIAGGHDLYRLSPRKRLQWRRQHLGLLLQHAPLHERKTAIENVAVAAAIKSVPRRDRFQRGIESLDSVGLDQRTTNRPPELSGGERQRLGLATVLASGFDFLMCDEPTGALDTATGTEVMTLIRGAADRGAAVLVATHDRAVSDAADQVVALRDGRRVDH